MVLDAGGVDDLRVAGEVDAEGVGHAAVEQGGLGLEHVRVGGLLQEDGKGGVAQVARGQGRG